MSDGPASGLSVVGHPLVVEVLDYGVDERGVLQVGLGVCCSGCGWEEALGAVGSVELGVLVGIAADHWPGVRRVPRADEIESESGSN